MLVLDKKTNALPIKIMQILRGSWAIQALRTGLELNIFDQLENGAKDALTIAANIKADKRAVEILLDVLTSLELLHKSRNSYALSEDARTYLLTSSSLYVGSYVKMCQEKEAVWQSLSSVVLTGKPLDQLNENKRAEEFFPALAEMLFPMNFALAQRVAKRLQISQLPAQSKILDVGAGAGTWSIPMALVNQNVHVDALDFSTTLEATKKFAKKYKVSDRYDYMPGNWRDVQWNESTYDVVILGHILCTEGKELGKQLIEQCFKALKPNGILLIAEMISSDDQVQPSFAVLAGLNMLINTTQGCVFTESELKNMLSTSGFIHTFIMPTEDLPASPIMISYKPIDRAGS